MPYRVVLIAVVVAAVSSLLVASRWPHIDQTALLWTAYLLFGLIVGVAVELVLRRARPGKGKPDGA